MKIALVHDYLRDFGGAERVLKTLTEIFPRAPIYTAFVIPESDAGQEFKGKKIYESKWAWLIKHGNLYSPLRFLLPSIWKSLDLSEYDLVITSTSNYIARGFKTGPKTKIIAYCHTPPRWLYGYQTGDLTKILPIRIYAQILAHFIRIFDFNSAQKVDHWIVNSQNVAARVEKFYRQKSTVIYPPVAVKQLIAASKRTTKKDFFLIASRLVGTKGLVETATAAQKLGLKLKIVGGAAGILSVENRLKKLASEKIQLLGRVSDKELFQLYSQAQGFLALARDEDFGITPVEAMAAGTPVIAFKGGGFLETLIDGKTGIFIEETDVQTLEKALKRFKKIKWNKRAIQNHAQKFSQERFKREIKEFVQKHAQTEK